MASSLDKVVLEPGKFLQLDFPFGQCSHDCPSACSSKVYGKEISVIFHYMFFCKILLAKIVVLYLPEHYYLRNNLKLLTMAVVCPLPAFAVAGN